MQIAFIFGTVVAGLVGVLLAIFLAPFLVAPPTKVKRRRKRKTKTAKKTSSSPAPASNVSSPPVTATIYYSPFEEEEKPVQESTRTRRTFGQRPFTRPAGVGTQSGTTLSSETTEPTSKYVPPALRRLQARKEKEQTVKVYLEERAAKKPVAPATTVDVEREEHSPVPEPFFNQTVDALDTVTSRWGKEGWVWQQGGKPVEVSRPLVSNNRWARSPRANDSVEPAPKPVESPVTPQADAGSEAVAITLDPRLLDAFAQFKEEIVDTPQATSPTRKAIDPAQDMIIDPRLLQAFSDFKSTMVAPDLMNKNLRAAASEFKPRSFQLDPAAPSFDPAFAS